MRKIAIVSCDPGSRFAALGRGRRCRNLEGYVRHAERLAGKHVFALKM